MKNYRAARKRVTVSVGESVRIIRELQGLSQNQLAQRTGIDHCLVLAQAEVDFIIDDMAYAIEAKASRSVTSDHLKGLRELSLEHPRVKRRFVISLDARPRVTEDGIEVLPHKIFMQRLWQGDLLR